MHDRIAKAVVEEGFPKKVIRLALVMYRSARHTQCADALSCATYTKQGVLAPSCHGCVMPRYTQAN